MAELCAKPSAKGDNLLSQDHITLNTSGGGVDASQPKSGGVGLGRLGVAWMAVTTLIAIASLIMAAWSTSRLQRTTPIVLVSNLQQAYDRGWTPLGSLYAGSGYWSNRSKPMSMPRSDHGAVAYQGRIYVFGGTSYDPVTGVAVVLRNMTRYDMYNNNFTEKDLMPDARYRFGYAVLNDKLYIFGGFNQVEPPQGGLAPVTTTMVFDMVTEKWQAIDPSMSLAFARSDLTGASIGGKALAVGGYDPMNNYIAVGYAEIFDPTAGRWSRVADLPTPRGDLNAQGIGNVAYVMGGVANDGDVPWVGTVEAFDITTGQWTRRANMTYPRGDFASEVLSNGNILTAGGEGSFKAGNESQTNEVARPWVEEYIPSLDIWVPKAALFEPRFRFDMASDDGVFAYAFGGAATCNDNDGNQADNCYKEVLSTILGYHDVPLPNIFAAMT